MRKIAPTPALLATILIAGCLPQRNPESQPKVDLHPGRYTVIWAPCEGYRGIFTCEDYRIVDGRLRATVKTVLASFSSADGIDPGDVVEVSTPFSIVDNRPPREASP